MNETIAIMILGIFVIIFIAIECFTMFYAYETHKLLDGNLGINLNAKDITLPYNWSRVYTVPVSAMSNQYMLALSIMPSSYDVESFTNDVKSNKVTFIVFMGTVYGIQYYMTDKFHVMFWVNLVCGQQGLPIVCGIPYLKPIVTPGVVQLLGYNT